MSGPAAQELARLGVATVYEASGQQGLVNLPLHQIIGGSRAAGPARTVLCGQDDNLAVHRVMAEAQPGEVLVLTMPEPRPVGLMGELLVIQAQVKRVAALLIDAAVRDVNELERIGLPVWARFIRAAGATKTAAGEINQPITVGGALIEPGDLVVLDDDGAVVVSGARIEEVLAAAREREAKETALREKLLQGEITYDLFGLRGSAT
jgi:4-hydroxy-4-methyl-2-oxoglutarate aldolase